MQKDPMLLLMPWLCAAPQRHQWPSSPRQAQSGGLSPPVRAPAQGSIAFSCGISHLALAASFPTVSVSLQRLQGPPCQGLCAKALCFSTAYSHSVFKLLLLVLVAFLCRESISSQCVGWNYSEAVCRLITARQETASLSLRSVVFRTDMARETRAGQTSHLFLKPGQTCCN